MMIAKPLLSFVLLSASAVAAADSINAPSVASETSTAHMRHPLSAYGELGGPGGGLSVNVELFPTQQTSWRLGLGTVVIGGAIVGSFNWMPGSGAHRPELGLGLSKFTNIALWGSSESSGFIPSVSAGYRYQPASGFMFRGGVTIFTSTPGDSQPAPWPYLSLGHTF